MGVWIQNVRVYQNGGFHRQDCFLAPDGVSFGVFPEGSAFDRVIDGHADFFLLPGLVDVHVHLREPGFLEKETIKTGTKAAAGGGYTTVCAMPNLNPPPDSPAHLAVEEAAIKKDAVIRVLPYGTVTVGGTGRGQLTDMDALCDRVVAFSDDGKGVQDEETMRRAMQKAKALGKRIVAHCEDERLLGGKDIHDGAYARAHGMKGIRGESEWRQVERDIALVRETGCPYHVCHISTKESVSLIRQAKKEGLPVTCETAPHYLLLSENDLQEDGRFKMNPPLRTEADRQALLTGIKDGTIDMIATDHAPHTEAQKSGGLTGSLMGVVGLECAFPVLYTKLVLTGLLSLERLIFLMSERPKQVFSLGEQPNDWFLFDPTADTVIDPKRFQSKGRATPFAGMPVRGRILSTFMNGVCVWNSTEN